MTVEYGGEGCRCWRSEDYNPWDDRTHHEWLLNPACPHHGTPRRDLSTPPDGPLCPPGVHSMFDFCPGGCLDGDSDSDAYQDAFAVPDADEDGWWQRHTEGAVTGPVDCQWGDKYRCRRHCPDDADALCTRPGHRCGQEDAGPCNGLPRPGSVAWFTEERTRRDACKLDGTFGPHDHIPNGEGNPVCVIPAPDMSGRCGDCQYCRTTEKRTSSCHSANPPGRKILAALTRGLKRLLT